MVALVVDGSLSIVASARRTHFERRIDRAVRASVCAGITGFHSKQQSQCLCSWQLRRLDRIGGCCGRTCSGSERGDPAGRPDHSDRWRCDSAAAATNNRGAGGSSRAASDEHDGSVDSARRSREPASATDDDDDQRCSW